MIENLAVSTELRYSPHTNTILLGYEIGSAKLPHQRIMRVVVMGKTIRFHIDGIDGYVDLNLNELAHQAATLLTQTT